ncbi:hypothetical protein PZA11_003326 [Diplocarpon coronariae]
MSVPRGRRDGGLDFASSRPVAWALLGLGARCRVGVVADGEQTPFSLLERMRGVCFGRASGQVGGSSCQPGTLSRGHLAPAWRVGNRVSPLASFLAPPLGQEQCSPPRPCQTYHRWRASLDLTRLRVAASPRAASHRLASPGPGRRRPPPALFSLLSLRVAAPRQTQQHHTALRSESRETATTPIKEVHLLIARPSKMKSLLMLSMALAFRSPLLRPLPLLQPLPLLCIHRRDTPRPSPLSKRARGEADIEKSNRAT